MKSKVRMNERSRKSLLFGVSLGVLLLASMIELSGCAGSQSSKVADATPTQTTKGTNTDTDKGTGTGNITQPPAQIATPPAQTTTAPNAPTPTNTAGVLTGTFLSADCNALNYGKAVVTQTGPNQYHLVVSTVHGFGHNFGNIESDFTYDGKSFVLADARYSQVALSFTDHTITIDYPGEGFFGGAGAEPKGTYYLSNSEDGNGTFLSKLYDSLKLEDSYRHGVLDVTTYPIGEQSQQQELLLVQVNSGSNPSLAAPNSLVVYDPNIQTFDDLGEVTESVDLERLHAKLEALEVDPRTIYEVLHKDFYDRFLQLQMDKFDKGSRDLNQMSLTDAEAFYIVTGKKGVTSSTYNHRNAQNIGSVYITEVDKSDDKTVTIHQYENVRNSATESHNATIDWFEVNRATGEVKSILYES